MGIDWAAFSWEAFATLFTGLAAVMAAAVIGWRQSTIMAQQVEIQQQTLRSELFDRRMRNFDTVQRLIYQVRERPDAFNASVIHQFHGAIDEAKFLFPQDVSERLLEIYGRMGELNAIDADMRSEIIGKGHAGVELPQKKLEAGRALSRDIEALPDIYSDMKLFQAHRQARALLTAKAAPTSTIPTISSPDNTSRNASQP